MTNRGRQMPKRIARMVHQQRNSARTSRQDRAARGAIVALLVAAVLAALASPAWAQSPLPDAATQVTTQTAEPTAPVGGLVTQLVGNPQQWTTPQGLSSTLQVLLLLTVLSLAPAVLLMTTCFVRIIVVLGLLRQALGTQQLPPSQVMTSLALFMTVMVMTPVWSKVYDRAIAPYTQGDGQMTLDQMWREGVAPVRDFMIQQIKAVENDDDVWLFYDYQYPDGPEPSSYQDIPLQVLLPAYMLSELKTAFLIGFQIYLPFLILDIVVASVTISMGMLMLPPVIISLPFKLLLFVLVDGWRLVVGMLLESFGPVT
jgi:flagellar biosynthesis protein FliP